MRPEERSLVLLRITRSKAKMYEYGVPERDHIALPRPPAELLTLTVGILGEVSARINVGDADSDRLEQLQESLRFAARYFDSYRQSRLAAPLDAYLLLTGAASYYLCDLPGSSEVLATKLSPSTIELDARGLERLLLWLLKRDFVTVLANVSGFYGDQITGLSEAVVSYYQDGSSEDELVSIASQLRRSAYENGTPRELLFADAVAALVRRRYENSSRFCLPLYSKLPISDWISALSKPTFIREFWPAQRLLGEKGVFEGASAVVQMPTSAGKSRAIELVIRSAFLAGRAALAVVVAPFRALCHEIRDSLGSAFQAEPVSVDELSDVFQADFDVEQLLSMRGVLVVTPEKLVYVLRHAPELAKRIELLIYDEGHQFDTGARGVTFELLITSLKTMVTATIQTILISAVLPNAETVGTWLNGETPNVVSGRNLIPTERTVAFASWQDRLGQLQFVELDNPEEQQFFVPRILESHELQRRPRERTPRLFPDKNDGGAIALYLGLRVVKSGSVAVFCGRKSTVGTLCEKLVDAYSRGLQVEPPLAASSVDEVHRISQLYERNLGAGAAATQSARLGVFTHHGNTPHGVRLAVEHGMKMGLVRFVICTSTLAQGVNLPIRYLIVTSVYQGGSRIKARDFHNLIGRAGRSGMHTEGSIIFADPDIYDKRTAKRERWRWLEIGALLQPEQSEPCDSTLLSVLSPLESDDRSNELQMEPMEVPRAYVAASNSANWVSDLAARYAQEGFTQANLEEQIARKAEILAAVESFLLAHWEDVGATDVDVGVRELVEGTLAFHLAGEEIQESLVEMFQLLARHIEEKASDSVRRRVFARMLCGLDDAIYAEAWVSEHIAQMMSAESDAALLPVVWPFLVSRIKNATFQRCRPSAVLQDVALGWIEGRSFGSLHQLLQGENASIAMGEKRARQLKVDDVVEICENALGYGGALAVGVVVEVVGFLFPEHESLLDMLQALQKRIKYGLSSSCAISLYELGFADRVIADELSQIVGEYSFRSEIKRELQRKEQGARSVLQQYPVYFLQVLEHLSSVEVS